MFDGHNGVTYATATEIRDEYPDVTPALLRTWVHEGNLAIVTVAELADALGVTVPDGINPDQPARARGRSGFENVYRWHEAQRVEIRTRKRRQAHGGRPRGRNPTPDTPACAAA